MTSSRQQAANDLSVHHIDGPMLGHLNHFTTKKKSSSTSTKSNNNITNRLPVATTSLVPILTPPISSIYQQHSSDDSDNVINVEDLNNKNQYLIVPNEQRINVRSAHSGKSITQLTIPSSTSDATTDNTSSTDTNNVTIRAVTLTWLPIIKDTDNDDTDNDDEMSTSSTSDNNTGEWVILAGCNNGMIYEWSVSDPSSTSYSEKEGGEPRRSFQLTSSSNEKEGLELIHLTSPANPADEVTSKYLSLGNDGKAVLYGLVVIKGENRTELMKCEISPYNNKDTTTKQDIELQTLSTVITSSSKLYNEQVIQNKHICLKKKDEIFGLLAVYRPTSSNGMNNNNDLEYMLDNTTDTKLSGDVFVVMCSSNGIIIYRDYDSNNENDNNDDLSTKLVHFTKLVKLPHYTKEQLYLSSISISPNVKDIVIGRINGHIDLLDNVFENVINYLNNHHKKEVVEHPELITVRRTMHWHAHPVRSLAFVTAQGRQFNNKSTTGDFANPMSLLSGGEESVLVTW